MQIPILVEPIEGGRFRVQSGDPLALCVEAASKTEAIDQLRAKIAARLQAGAEILSIVVLRSNLVPKPVKNPKDDPLWEEWKKAMADYRRQVDEEPDIV